MVTVKFYPKATRGLKQIKTDIGPSVETNQKNQDPFYYYVGIGDFSIIWPNVIGFALIHLFVFFMYYELYFNSEGEKLWTHLNSLVWCKYVIMSFSNIHSNI